MAQQSDRARTSVGPSYALGAVAAFLSFLMWGLLPPYWKALGDVGALEVLAHRIFWSAVFLTILMAVRGDLGRVRAALVGKRTGRLQLLNAAMLGLNWGVFVWGVQAGRVVECSMGYYINPLVNVALGALVLREQLRRPQIAAIMLAGVGVVYLTVSQGVVPWLGLTLAASFALYALVRKLQSVEALPGVTAECLLLSVPALLYLLSAPWTEVRWFWSYGGAESVMLPGAGVVTAVPLLLFGLGVRRIRLTTLGFLQYTAPTCMFLLGLLVYHEPFSTAHAVSFGFIWLALGIYMADAVRNARATRPKA